MTKQGSETCPKLLTINITIQFGLYECAALACNNSLEDRIVAYNIKYTLNAFGFLLLPSYRYASNSREEAFYAENVSRLHQFT